MLVLSRKESERIKVGDSIVVTVVRVAGDKVRLGIDAPPDMVVLREELDAHHRPTKCGHVGVSEAATAARTAAQPAATAAQPAATAARTAAATAARTAARTAAQPAA